MPKKKNSFQCSCGGFEVKGSLNQLIDLNRCPVHGCGREISLPNTDQIKIEKIEVKIEPESQTHNTGPPILTAQGHLHEKSPTYFATSERNQRVISAIMKGR